MTRLDWIVLCGTIAVIVGLGLWRTRGVRSAEGFLRGGSLPWWTIGLSIMATQASAITFLSMPGQAYDDGMGFVQFYFGQPIAMVILCYTLVPIYTRLKVYTAYEWLETRFDRKTRQLTAALFLVARGLAAGISIYAPAIIVSTVMGWPLVLCNLVIGVIVILYTVSGGTRAVSQTQTGQMAVMMGGMVLAFVVVVHQLPPEVSVVSAVRIAGILGRTKVIDLSLAPGTRYTLWSGLLGGLFVGLAYFGTDQSQVQRYLSSSLRESRLGLLFNALFKVPMQLLILLVGVMVFVFFQFHAPPAYFARAELMQLHQGPHAAEVEALEAQAATATEAEHRALEAWLHDASASNTAQLASTGHRMDELRGSMKALVKASRHGAVANDADYIFLRFVLEHFPSGLVGLLLAVIFCAAMSATASALNALSATTVVDFYKVFRPAATDAQTLRAAQALTVFWGLVAMSFAASASLVDNLIQAVNILGSIFYGPTLGVFLVGFFLRRVPANAVFIALVVGQILVVLVFAFSSIGFLWYNVIGCAAVTVLSLLLAAAGVAGRRPAYGPP